MTSVRHRDRHALPTGREEKSGLLGSGGIGFTIGKQSSKHEIDEKGRTQSQSVSTVGSSRGSVNITAGNQLHIGGADTVAGKDLTLTGDSVTIDPGYDQRTRKETYEQKQSGLSVALSGTVGGALNTAVSSAQQARKEGDVRLNALQNTKAALSGVQAAQAAELDKLNTDAGKAPPTPSASVLPTAASRRRAKPAPTAASRRAARSPPGKTCR